MSDVLDIQAIPPDTAAIVLRLSPATSGVQLMRFKAQMELMRGRFTSMPPVLVLESGVEVSTLSDEELAAAGLARR